MNTNHATFATRALIPIANGSNPFSRLPDSTISFELIQQVLLEDIESFFRLSATCVPLYHKCNIVLFKAVTGHLKERRKVMDEFPIGLQTKLKGGKSSIDAIRKVLRRMGRIVGGFEVLLKGEEYSHRPLIPVHNHVSDINKLQSFAAFIQTVSKSSPGIPAAANDPPAKVPLDVIAFFMFHQNKLTEIWASVEFLKMEANWPRSMFSAHVTGGSEFGRPTISLELTDTCETIGVWTRERDQLKRRYLVPVFRVGLPNSDHLLRILVDCTLESDTFGACFLERGLDGLFRIDEEFLMSELERFSDSFMEAMEKVLQLERGVFQEGRDGFWR